jgi:predicted RNA binding protein YcfA (HicA-like mRNA interferase family)
MSPLPVLKAREVVAVLKRMGFEESHQRGSHLRLKHPDGRQVTLPVHYGKDLNRNMLRAILSQARVTEQEFLTWR